MKVVLYTLAVLLILGGLAYHFAALRLFNALVPKDGGTVLLAEGVPFGPHPREVFDIYAPELRAGPLPVVVFINGGSWASGRRQDYEFVGRAFAAQGFVTVLADYRLVPEVRYPDFVEDAALAIAAVQREVAGYGGDAGRIYLVGHSAGAYNIVQAVLNPMFFETAGVDRARIKGVVSLAGPFDFLPLDVKASIEAFGFYPDPAATQPINFVRADAPPMLLLHGLDDATVGVHNSRNLAARLKQVGAEVETKEYKAIGHAMIMLALAKPLRERAPVLEDAIGWILSREAK